MEAVGELAPNQAARLGQFSNAPLPLRAGPAGGAAAAAPLSGWFAGQPVQRALRAVPVSERCVPADGDLCSSVTACLELLTVASPTAAGEVALLGFREAADFARAG